ncbi:MULTISPECIES: DUF1592 domain-containing protein [Sorangium]|uniref:DUF1592 domain-containing protein n=1 Tax=Sorangium cellulosum TaxID=56 RepID=A0A4P2R3P7_SORCE|nr:MULTISPECIES: DUF1592 domain-containing protein [Sorangium]AUX37679.1 hypothetical protein SOCE836_099090 [Sorangium cellulosum]WCQ96968.1 hypothetical protein NQZ70_09758 [Sorangium sp. Soce836]
MRTLRQLSYIGTTIFLTSTAFLASCTGNIADNGGDDDNPTGGSGSTGTGGGIDNGPPDVCIPGLPATTQIPRLLNRQYDNTVRDLLGVTRVGAEGKPPSELLVSDFDGPMTPDAWRIYQEVAAAIAKDVMAGPNKSKFISCDPAASGCLTQTIQTFGRKAFRRPLTAEEVARFEKLGQTTPAGTPAEVAETTLYAFLVSPSFLMLPELTTTPASSGNGIQLSSYEVATRLSYLLWGSAPDDTLNAAADNDELQTKEQILAQAQRMIDVREKTGPLVAAFHRNWAQMDNDLAHWWKGDHDTETYPLYNASAKPSWQAELDAFFEEVAFGGGSFKDLLLSNVAFVNKENAAIYGLDPAAYGAELTKVELDANERPGFLTRVGFLSSYSSYNATSPILRGAFIATYLLGVNPGPPLPGATMLTVDGQFDTQRAYVEALTKPESCKGCHAVVNPPGFVMEGFDGIGKMQTTDPRGGVIDASVTTNTIDFGDGNVKEITSPFELMQEIAQVQKAKELYAQAWVSYAFGRLPNGKDKCVVDMLQAKLSESGYSVLDLMADLTQADSFRVRIRETQ